MIKIMKYGEIPNSEIFAREEQKTNVTDIVTDIITTVRKDGDQALFFYNKKFDGCELTNLEVSEAEIEEAFETVEPRLLEILRNAEKNIRAFHQKQVHNSFIINECNGIVMGQKVTPIEKVGIYVPGGTAAYPSTVLMDSVPANFILPMDETLILSAVDLSGRSYLNFGVDIPTEKIGSFDSELVEEFFYGFVRQCPMSLHICKMAGTNSHHIVEGIFKAVARALKVAVALDGSDQVPSTKGMI